MAATRKVKTPPSPSKICTRRAELRLSSFNPETRKFSAVAASGKPVRRADPNGSGYYFEVLEIAPKAIRLDRLKAGTMPLLDSHQYQSLQNQLGVVTGAHIENGALIIDAQLSARADLKPIADDMVAGVLPNISIGYRVYASTESTAKDGTPVVTHTDWEPVEVSLVALGADLNARIRSERGPTMPELTELEESTDDRTEQVDSEETETRTEGNNRRTRGMSDRDARRAYEMAARNSERLPQDFAYRTIQAGVTFEEFRTRMIDEMANRNPQIGLRGASMESILNPLHSTGQTFDNPDFLGRSIGDALYSRMAGKKPEGAAAELMGRSMLDMGAMILQARGERVSWLNRDSLATKILTRSGGDHSTSDFPFLLTSAGNRVLLDAYKAAACPLKDLGRQRDASDFRAISLVKLSEAPRLVEVAEGGEVTHGSRGEAKQGFVIKTYARIFSLTRQAIINDDLGAFADSNAAWGRASAQTEADLLAGLFTANAGNGIDLDDGDPVYDAGRGNKAGAGAAINVTSLSAARQAMRDVKGLDGKTLLNVVPVHLVVGSAKETEAEQFINTIAAAQATNVNPFSGKLQLHVEPRLSGNAWRLFADPANVPTILYGYLNGVSGPVLAQREGWEVLGVEFRAVLDFGCGIQDWRGTYLNPGN